MPHSAGPSAASAVLRFLSVAAAVRLPADTDPPRTPTTTCTWCSLGNPLFRRSIDASNLRGRRRGLLPGRQLTASRAWRRQGAQCGGVCVELAPIDREGPAHLWARELISRKGDRSWPNATGWVVGHCYGPASMAAGSNKVFQHGDRTRPTEATGVGVASMTAAIGHHYGRR